jgi:hypothetical protein
VTKRSSRLAMLLATRGRQHSLGWKLLAESCSALNKVKILVRGPSNPPQIFASAKC